MGSVSLKIGEGTARYKKATLCSSTLNLLMLISVVTTNLFALYAFTYNPNNIQTLPNNNTETPLHQAHKNMSLLSQQVALIIKQIESSQSKLSKIEKQILGYESFDLSNAGVVAELGIYLEKHLLPLGKDSRTGITSMVASVGHSCSKSMDMLKEYMKYKVYGQCPDDLRLAQKLILRGCEPLPRRRCLVKSGNKMGLIYPYPTSLWKSVSDKVVSWGGFSCKNFSCLNGKKLSRDCGVGCFDLVNGFETQRFVKSRGKNDFLIDDVLGLSSGVIRIGLDIAGGSGTFAARMAEKNVTLITQSLNDDAPYNEFIAARGLFPMFMSLDHRLPFYDNVFDLVHAGSVLDVGGRPEKLEFLMFDIDRVLKVGGLFWLDNFYCASDEKKRDLTRLIERFGYKKLKWVVGEKVESGKTEVYLSAVLQKPVRQ